jgi:hypothetical protein
VSRRAKYPIAIINQLLQIFGPRLGIGYDIACSFSATIAKSSIAPLAHQQSLRLCVPSFHGYAHNRACQLDWHPLYVKGFGIEDLEGCERIFSNLNGVAQLTQHGSRFHRHQSIDMALAQWDEDKEFELSMYKFGVDGKQ